MRKNFSRFLLVALVGVLVFVVIRTIDGGSNSDGLVSIGPSLGTSELHHEAFRVNQQTELAIRAVGSFESDTSLAAYGWIVDRNAGEVAWRMDASSLERGRGTLATFEDTLRFEPGVYDAYFTSYGDPLLTGEDDGGGFLDQLGDILSNGGRAWHADAARWELSITLADQTAFSDAANLYGDEGRPDRNLRSDSGIVWYSPPAQNRDQEEFQFEVTERSSIQLSALAEFVDGEWADAPQITRLFSDDVIWSAEGAQSEWAGGTIKNRRIDAELVLEPGLYSASYTTDGSHSYDRWTANPPWVPVDWGMKLVAADSSAAANIVAFDAWDRLPRIASFTCVGSDEYREDAFSISDSTDVLLYAMGEISGSTRYDFATLIRVFNDRAGVEEVWTMTRENSERNAREDKNRLSEVLLKLAPGSYRFTYESDGSYDCESFDSGAPYFLERWGATLFALDPNQDMSAIERIDPRQLNRERLEALRAGGEELLADISPVRNGERRQATFFLQRESNVRIYAIGEMTPGDSYDYAWLEDGNGNEVWRMTRDNTSRAGGSAKNRVFDGQITLSSGNYSVHYRSDGSHAYEDFSQGAPYDPEGWGVQVSRVASE